MAAERVMVRPSMLASCTLPRALVEWWEGMRRKRAA